MALNYLTGLGADYYGEGLGRKSRAERKAKRQERRKTKGKNRIAKIGLAPARAAFLTAVKLNVKKLADKLAQAYKKDRSKVENLWSKFGGTPDKLREAIEKGFKGKLNGSLGAEPVTLSAGLVSAVPVVIKFVQLFKELGILSPKEESEFQNDINDAKNQLELDGSIEKDQVDLPVDASGNTPETSKILPSEEDEAPEKTPFYKNPYVIIGGVAVLGALFYFGTRKKQTAQ